MKSIPFASSPRVKSVLGLSLALLLPAVGHAATISLTAGGSSTNNSYSAKDLWSNGAAPSGTNDYVTGAFTVRTLSTVTGSPNTFAGNSLTVGNGTSASSPVGALSDKGTSSSTLTINDLRMNGGAISIGASGATGTWNIAGNMTLQTNGGALQANASSAASQNRILAVSSNISGSGPLFIQNATLTAGNTATASVILSGTNTFTGTTTVGTSTTDTTTAKVRLTINPGSTVGTILNVLANGALTLNSATNLGATQSLWLDNDLSTLGLVNLNFSSTTLVAALSFDGGTTFAAPGTYGAMGSTATNQSDFFIGTGTITVVPEPATGGMIVALGLLLISVKRMSTRTARDS